MNLRKDGLSGLKRRQARMAALVCLASSLSLSALSNSIGVLAAVTPAITRVPGEEPSTAQQARIRELEANVASAQKRGSAADQADAYYRLGQSLFEAGNPQRAEECLRQSMLLEEKAGRPAQSIQVRIALAHLMTSMKRIEEAKALYHEALDKARKSKKHEEMASVLDNMASVSLLSGDLEKAEKLLNEAIILAQEEKLPAVEANAWINLAGLSAARKQNDVALVRAKKAVALLKGSEELRALGLAYRALGRTYANTGDFKQALDAYAQAAKCLEEEVEPVLEAQVYLAMGQLLLAERRAAEAKEPLKKAVEILRGEQEQRLLPECLIALGAAEADLANFSYAQQLHSQAIKLAAQNNNTRLQLLGAAEEGYDFLLQGLLEKALAKFQYAHNLMDKARGVSDSDRAQILRDLGLCYRSLGQIDAAIKYYRDAALAFERAGDVKNQALMLNSVAVAYLDQGKQAEFEEEFARARELAGSTDNRAAEACLAYNYAQYQYMTRQYESAAKSYDEAATKAEAAQDRKTEGMALTGLGLAYLQLNKAKEARACFEKSAAIADKIGTLEAKWDAALGLGKAYKALSDPRSAETCLAKAINLVEAERSRLTRDTFKTFNMDQRQECFLEMIDLLASQKRADDALAVVEKGRARAFLDLLHGRINNADRDTVATIIDDDAHPQLRRTGGRELVAMAGPSAVRGIEITPRASSLVESSAVSPVNADPPSLAEIKELVARSKAHVLEYCMLRDKVLIFVVSPNGEVKMAPPVMIAAKDLRKKIQETRALITGSAASMKELNEMERKRQQVLQELYTLLIAPAVPFLPDNPEEVVTIVPHGPLFSVPFAALQAADGKFLVESRTLNYVPAIGVLRATQRLDDAARIAQEDSLIAFGNPITKVIAFLGTLPYAEKEVKKVAALFGEGKARVEIGEAANKAAFRELAPKNSIIHLATHGLINEEKPMESALVLAPTESDDGLLTVKDILQLPPLKAKVVVLSACQTGRGKITGDGVVGLSRAFIIAGTPSIIVSQWNVDDVMTEYQMEQFYKAFLAGKTKAQALRQAQLKTIAFMEKTMAASPASAFQGAGQAVRANPRLWAAFQLIGEQR
ncbi:MAG TPA: CHAT domain-containing protein [Candidatus Obscuribacterales bacterium]